MSYQVIARKYRPQRFADVVGQEHVTQTLANAIAQKRIAHAYLFVGPRGTGKTTIARIFAKCLNCTGGPKVDFADDDPRVQEITEGRSMDVLEIDGASNRGIDEVRELRETVRYAPAAARFKIYIIDEVHMLTKEAFNALLKTLEEPPEHVKFMFATTEAEKVLPTILSRCQRFDLRRIPSALIVKHLGEIAKREKVKIGEEALQAIARGADGGLRDAESTLDQLISFCGEEIKESDVLSMFGLASRGQIVELAGSVLAGQTEQALRQLNSLAGQGKDIGRLVSELLGHFRNLLIYQVSAGDLALLEATEAEAQSLKEQSAQVKSEPLGRMLEILTDCEGRLRDTSSKKILVEVTLLKMIEARNAVSIDMVLQHVRQLRAEAEGPASAGSSSRGAGASPEGSGSAPARAGSPLRAAGGTQGSRQAGGSGSAGASPYPAAGGSEGSREPAPSVVPTGAGRTTIATAEAGAPGDLHQLWESLREAVSRASPFVATYFKEAHLVSFVKNVVTIGFDPEFADHLPLVDNAKNHALVQTKLKELGHPNCQARFIKAEDPNREKRATASADAPAAAANVSTAPAGPAATPKAAAPGAPAAMAFNRETFKNDPLIQKALEVFKGQIVDIRS